MTDPPTRDPDLQQAIDRAAAELARRICAHPSPADVDAMARDYLAWLHDQGLRILPRPQGIPDRTAVRPADYKRRAKQAREALRAALTREDT